MKLLNIGCGKTIHPEWTNYDLVAEVEGVIAHDLTKGIPEADNSVDFTYSSHVLEHLNREEADFFIKEQYRILKEGGIIRVVVPDLEQITRNYLSALEELKNGNFDARIPYDYSLLELYDQTVRSTPGGELGTYWEQLKEGSPGFNYALERHGEEFNRYYTREHPTQLSQTLSFKVRNKLMSLRVKLFSLLAQACLGQRGAMAAREGLVRTSGVIHKVMYDRVALTSLLVKHGFSMVKAPSLENSYLDRFSSFMLDTDSNTKARKPDSLVIEGVK